jgi:D-amino-acid dehydrogenase
VKVIIVGAGVVGTTTALVLAERGVEVTLLDAEPEAGLGTSYANGSSLTPVHAEPWNPPGTLRRFPGALIKHRSPVRISPWALPGLFGWGRQFIHHSDPERYLRNARHCIRLALYAGQCLVALRERHALSYDQWLDGSMELYRSRQALEGIIAFRRQLDLPGIDFQTLSPDEILAREPALAPVVADFHGALWMPSHESGDVRRFSAEAARLAQSLGATLRFQTRVEAIDASNHASPTITTRDGSFSADRIILCTGTETDRLLTPLGLRVPIYPIQGYSLTVPISPSATAPQVPLLDAERRFVVARLGPGRLRIAGLADFSGHRRKLDPARLDFLRESAERLLPGLVDEIRADAVEPWTGLRPMTPDGPPLIGPTPINGLWLNTGHGSMGWTQAAGSAELLADLLLDQTPAIDPDGLEARRVFGSALWHQKHQHEEARRWHEGHEE